MISQIQQLIVTKGTVIVSCGCKMQSRKRTANYRTSLRRKKSKALL